MWRERPRAFVLDTSNITPKRERATFGDPVARIWRDGLLGYRGFARVRLHVSRVVATSMASERKAWLDPAHTMARALMNP